jgi:hypothetical protein
MTSTTLPLSGIDKWGQVLNSPHFLDRLYETRQRKLVSNKALFQETSGEFEQIQAEFQTIKELWLQAIDQKTRAIKDTVAINEGLNKLEDFINEYWKYFLPEDKKTLEEGAKDILKMYDNPLKTLILMVLNPKKLKLNIANLKYLLKNSRQGIKNPQDNPMFLWADTSKKLANDIIRLTEQDKQNAIASQQSQEISWEEEEEFINMIIEDIDEALNEECTAEDIAAMKRFQERLRSE